MSCKCKQLLLFVPHLSQSAVPAVLLLLAPPAAGAGGGAAALKVGLWVACSCPHHLQGRSTGQQVKQLLFFLFKIQAMPCGAVCLQQRE
jgi:hypothetical protein